MYYVSKFWGVFDPPTPSLSSKVSIWHDPLILRKVFLTHQEAADSKLWIVLTLLTSRSTSLAVSKNKFGCFSNFGSSNAANLLSCPETILYALLCSRYLNLLTTQSQCNRCQFGTPLSTRFSYHKNFYLFNRVFFQPKNPRYTNSNHYYY